MPARWTSPRRARWSRPCSPGALEPSAEFPQIVEELFQLQALRRRPVSQHLGGNISHGFVAIFLVEAPCHELELAPGHHDEVAVLVAPKPGDIVPVLRLAARHDIPRLAGVELRHR